MTIKRSGDQTKHIRVCTLVYKSKPPEMVTKLKTPKVYKNVMQCKICGSPADRIGGPPKVYGHDWPGWYFECQANRSHVADGFTGIFSDLSIKD